MAKAETPSLQAIQEQLGALLEERVTELMAQIKATQTLVRRIASTEDEIARHKLLGERLEAELGPLREEAGTLAAHTSTLQAELGQLSGTTARLREIRRELEALSASSEA
jgi:chromosome segregation ATPase